MLSALKLQPPTRPFAADFHHRTRPYILRLPAVRSQPSDRYISSVGSPPLSVDSTFTQRHILTLNVIAAASAISAAWLFFSAIPTLLSLKRAAESMEKLMDVAREELPDTMAAVRLSGMEISDLTMELSDLGQEITQGVRRSTSAVRVVEQSLRGLTNVSPPASTQAVATNPRAEVASGPAVAGTARGIRQGIVKGRSMVRLFFNMMNFSRMALKYLGSRGNRQT